MKSSILIIGASWVLSLVAAFLIGNGTNSSTKGAEDESSARNTPRSAPRKSDRSPSSRRGSEISAPGKRAGNSLATRIVSSQPPRQAVVELAQLNDPVERTKGFLALIESLSADEFLEVVQDFRALGMTEQRMSEYGMLLHAWGKTDPEGALAYAMENTGTPFARQTILASWAADNPEAAIAFAQDNHEGEGANPLLVGVIRGIAPNDLGYATNLLQDLPYSRERGEALRTILPFVMQDGVDTALTWTDGIVDERLKSGAITYIMSDLSQSSPEAAARTLTTLTDNEAAIRVADDVAGSLARVNIDRAITWVQTLESDVRREAIEGVVPHYASQDPQAAAQWLDSLSGTTNLDNAIRSFSWSTHREEPELAAEWIGRIESERTRTELYNGVLGRWLMNDTEAAEQWIASTPDLPEHIRSLPERMRERQNDPSRRWQRDR